MWDRRLSHARSRKSLVWAAALAAWLTACSEAPAPLCDGDCPSDGGLGDGGDGAMRVKVTLMPRTLRFCGLLPPSAIATVVSDPPGIRCGRDGNLCDASFPPATAVTLSAQVRPGGTLLGWQGPCEGGPGRCALKPRAGGVQVSANFDVVNALDVLVQNPSGGGYLEVAPVGESGVWDAGAGRCGGTGTSSCCAMFAPGTSVTLTAVYGPMVNYMGMSGDCMTRDPRCTLMVKGRVRVTASMPARRMPPPPPLRAVDAPEQ